MCEPCRTQEENENAYKTLVGKPEGKGPLGRPRSIGEGRPNFKIDLKYNGRLLTQFIWRAPVNSAVNLRVP
jgi:hypothetical protein